MHALVSMKVHEPTVELPVLRPREQSHERDQSRKGATYFGLVTHPAIRQDRFGQFIARGLNAARARGLTDRQIAQATGINQATFYRWQNGEVEPRFAKLQQFCVALGLDYTEALAALRGDTRQTTTPEPPMDPDVLRLLRKLADPNVSAETKAHIRATMRYLADLPEPKPVKKSRRRAS